MNPSIRALVPVAVAALSVLLAWAFRFTERSFIGTVFEDHVYGFFLRLAPLFLFCMVYGVARILVAALAAPGRRRALRWVTAPLAVGLFLAAGFYPTFGGIILRPGYMTGGMSFLNGTPGWVAGLAGAGAAALMFGLCLGLATLLATLELRPGWRAIERAAAAFLALWLAAAILTLPARFGLDPASSLPIRPLSLPQALATAALVGLALLPHALLAARARHAGPA